MLITSKIGWTRHLAIALPPLALTLAFPAILTVSHPMHPGGLRVIDVSQPADHGDEIPFCRADGAVFGASERAFRLCQPNDPWPTVCGPTSPSTELALPAPLSADEGALTFLVPGDLVVNSSRTLEFAFSGAAGRDIAIVVIGDVFIGDDLVVEEGVRLRLYAVRDRATGEGGDIVLHDPAFDTLSRVDAELIAAGHVVRRGAARSNGTPPHIIEGAPLSLAR